MLDNLTARENIVLPLAMHGENPKKQELKLQQLAKQFDIEDILNKFPSQISGGQKQRVAAAMFFDFIRRNSRKTRKENVVYFANKYQLQLRSHEFGLYLMMGMKRSRLFSMIMGETLWDGLVALIIGVPVSLFLTELISLATSRLIGMGIIGHRFRISWI